MNNKLADRIADSLEKLVKLQESFLVMKKRNVELDEKLVELEGRLEKLERIKHASNR